LETSPYVTADMKKRPAEDFAVYIQEFNDAERADRGPRIRGVRNTMAYASINDGMWAEELVARLKQMGQEPNTYPFIQLYVRGHTGNYMMNWFDPKFTDAEADSIDSQDACNAMQYIWYADKDFFGLKHTSMRTVEDGLNYRGVEKLVIRKPSSDPREWRIGFEPRPFARVIFDPSNVTDRISRNSRIAWEVCHLSPRDMLKIAPSKERDILMALERQEKNNGASYQEIKMNFFEDAFKSKVGKAYPVIQRYCIEEEKITHKMMGGMVLPVTGHPMDSVDDVNATKEWASFNGIMLNDLDIYTVTDYKPINYLAIFCPDLGIVFADGKDEVQLDGYLPFYSWSFIEKWGMSIGLTDIVYDSNQDILKRENAKTKMFTQTPIGGKTVISRALFDGSDEREESIIRDANDSSKPIIAPDGIPIDSVFRIIPGANVNPALFQEVATKIEMMNQTASLPMAMQGRSERAADSGIAIGRKVIEGSIMHKLPMETLMQHEHDKAADWMKMAIKKYGGRHNFNRTFSSGTGESRMGVTVNRLEGYDDNGNEVVKADLRSIKRPHVIISQTKENDFAKQAKREMDVAALQVIVPTPTNAPIRMVYESNLAMNQDYIDDAQKEKAKKAVELSEKLTFAQAELLLLDAEIKKQNLQKMVGGGPQGAPAAPGMEGMPPPQSGPTFGETAGLMPPDGLMRAPVPEVQSAG